MLGVIAAELELRDHPLRAWAPYLLPVALGAALAIEPFVSMPNSYGVDEHFFFWQTNPGWHVVAFLAVLSAGRVSFLRRVLSSPPFVATGLASYSIYLVHYPIVVEIDWRFMPWSEPLAFLLAAVLALAAGFAFFLLVERPLCFGAARRALSHTAQALFERAFGALRLQPKMTFGSPAPSWLLKRSA